AAAGHELLAAGTRPVRTVVDGHAGVLGVEGGDPGLLRRLLRAGTDAGEGARQVGAVAAGVALLVLAAARRGQGQGGRHGYRGGRRAPVAHGRCSLSNPASRWCCQRLVLSEVNVGRWRATWHVDAV